jgi:hypothetical protein
MSMGKDFVTYARTKGVFAGVSVEGASIRTRGDLNKAYYGSVVRPSDIELVRCDKSNPQSQVLHQAVVNDADRKGSSEGRCTVDSAQQSHVGEEWIVHIINGQEIRACSSL